MIIKLALFVTHNIFLTNNQINKLIDEKSIKCEGISVPVWVNPKNSKTTEPACEIFCKYEIVTEQKEDDIEITKKGYKIYLGKISAKKTKTINFLEMTEKERIDYEKKMDNWWKKNALMMDINFLQTSKYFRTKIKKLDQSFNKINSIADVQHTIEIKTIDSLIDSLS